MLILRVVYNFPLKGINIPQRTGEQFSSPTGNMDKQFAYDSAVMRLPTISQFCDFAVLRYTIIYFIMYVIEFPLLTAFIWCPAISTNESKLIGDPVPSNDWYKALYSSSMLAYPVKRSNCFNAF